MIWKIAKENVNTLENKNVKEKGVKLKSWIVNMIKQKEEKLLVVASMMSKLLFTGPTEAINIWGGHY